MRRREFIAGLGGAASWPLLARAERSERVRRLSILMGWNESDPQAKDGLSAFAQGLEKLGWTEGRNLRLDIRWTSGSADRRQMFAKELVDSQPDVILSNTTPVTAALLRQTRTIPIVFVIVSDPVGSGFVTSLAEPGGNVTGFINMEGTIGGKWIQLLMEIAPRVKRVAIMFNPDTAVGGGTYFLSSIKIAAESLQVDSIVTPVRSDAEIESVITALGSEPGGGLVAASDSFVQIHRAPIIAATVRNKVPTVFAETIMVRDGGLVSYSSNYTDIFRRAAAYVDRIFRGEKPEDLPVQVPTRFETALNLRTAKALGLDVPPSILARADEVIE